MWGRVFWWLARLGLKYPADRSRAADIDSAIDDEEDAAGVE